MNYIDMEKMIADVAKTIRRGRQTAREGLNRAENLAPRAIEEGWTESGLARALGVDRMTVRKWLGK